MRFKKETPVKVNGVKPEIVLAMQVANEVYKSLGSELVITSVVDGKHSLHSLHYIGHAFDCRTRDLGEHQASVAVTMLRERLTDEYDVVLEDTHIHIEFQPEYS